MKRHLFTSFIYLVSIYVRAQGGSDNWKTDGNVPQPGSFFGTKTNFPINFRVNNTQKMVLDPLGDLSLTNLAGSGSRVLLSDQNGKLLALPAGNNGQYLQADGTWGYLPAGATNWQFLAGNLFNVNTGNIGIGTSNPQYKLDVQGSVRISNNLLVGGGIVTTQSLNTSVVINAGDVNVINDLNVTGSSILNGALTAYGNINIPALGGGTKFKQLYVTPSGNVVSSIELEPGWLDPSQGQNSCNPYSKPWLIGGNAIIGSGYNDISIGTCDNTEFMLKTNGTYRQWIKTDGTFGFGTFLASNTGGPEYKFHKGALRLTGQNSYGGPQIVFDGGISPFGDWGIEYNNTQFYKDGLNFWKPFGSPNSFNAMLFLADDGSVGIGTDSTTSRLTVDAWTDNGLKVMSANSRTSIEVFNKNTNRTEFKVHSNGTVYSREIYVRTGVFPDYVFNKNYQLLPILKLKDYIQSNKKLPNLPSAKEVENDGLQLGEISRLHTEKIEELSLYVIQLKEEIDELRKQLEVSKQKK